MENQTETNEQIFNDYYKLIVNTHTPRSRYEAKRLLEKFRAYLGQFPPDAELAVQFFDQFKSKRPSTRARQQLMISGFFRWYSLRNSL